MINIDIEHELGQGKWKQYKNSEYTTNIQRRQYLLIYTTQLKYTIYLFWQCLVNWLNCRSEIYSAKKSIHINVSEKTLIPQYKKCSQYTSNWSSIFRHDMSCHDMTWETEYIWRKIEDQLDIYWEHFYTDEGEFSPKLFHHILRWQV